MIEYHIIQQNIIQHKPASYKPISYSIVWPFARGFAVPHLEYPKGEDEQEIARKATPEKKELALGTCTVSFAWIRSSSAFGASPSGNRGCHGKRVFPAVKKLLAIEASKPKRILRHLARGPPGRQASFAAPPCGPQRIEDQGMYTRTSGGPPDPKVTADVQTEARSTVFQDLRTDL